LKKKFVVCPEFVEYPEANQLTEQEEDPIEDPEKIVTNARGEASCVGS